MADSLGEMTRTNLVVTNSRFLLKVLIATLKAATFVVLKADSPAQALKVVARYEEVSFNRRFPSVSCVLSVACRRT